VACPAGLVILESRVRRAHLAAASPFDSRFQRAMLDAKHMPKDSKGQKRPADVIGSAVHVMKIATGEIREEPHEEQKNQAAVELGRKGGLARANATTRAERRKIALKGAQARWKGKRR
jgi:hypothetical protein